MKKFNMKPSHMVHKLSTKILITETKVGKWKSKEVFKTNEAKLISELIGTFFLVFLIIAPSAFNFGDSTYYASWWTTLWSIPLFATLWPALAIGSAIVLFYKISCNLNPAVSFFEWKLGIYSTQLLIGIITVQFIGAIAASFAAYGIADAAGVLTPHAVSSTGEIVTKPFELDAVAPVYQFNWPTGKEVYIGGASTMEGVYQASDIGLYMLTMIFEFIGVCALLYLIIKLAYQPSFGFKMVFTTWILIRFMLPSGTFDLNPARNFGPALVSFTMGGAKGPLMFCWIYIIPQFAAAYFMGAKLKGTHQLKTVKLRRMESGINI